MGVNAIFQQYSSRVCNNGAKTIFWEDVWINNSTLASQFPRLYTLAFDKKITVRKVKIEGFECIRFRRLLYGETAAQWDVLRVMVDVVQLKEEKDTVSWRIGNSRKFSVKSLYLQLRAGTVSPFKHIWKIKIPLKVRVFLWLMLRDSILTKDNLLKRGWTGNDSCYFCGRSETVDHLLFHCTLSRLIWQVISCAFGLVSLPSGSSNMLREWLMSFPTDQRGLVVCGGAAVVWTIWKTRNDACFKKKYPDDPASVVYRICRVINSWAILQKEQDRENLEDGVRKMKIVIREAYSRSHGWSSSTARLAA